MVSVRDSFVFRIDIILYLIYTICVDKMADLIEIPLDRHLGLILHDVTGLLRRAFDRRVNKLGLTRSQWFALAYLYREEGMTQARLRDVLEMEPASLGQLLDRMENGGWIRREPHPTDRRAKLVFCTDKIDPLIDDLRRKVYALYDDALRGMSEQERKDLIDNLLLMKENLSQVEANIKEVAAK